MKRVQLFAVGAAALAVAAVAGGMFAGAAEAQSSRSAPVILILNQAQVIAQSKAGQSMKPQLEKLQEAANTELNEEISKLQKEAEDLKKQRELLAEDVWMQKAQQIAIKEQNLPAIREVKVRELSLSEQKALNEINEAMKPILKSIVEKNGATLMLERSAVMYASQETDITSEVISELDKKLKSVKVEKVDIAELQRQLQEQQKEAAKSDGKKRK